VRIVWRPAVAVHWRRQLVYFSTSRDQVHRISLNVTGQYGAAAVGAARRRARTPAVTQAAAPGAKVVYQAGSGPSGAGLRLSVDWLYDRLYVADQSTVSTLHSHLPVAMATAPPGVGACVCSHLLDDAARSYPANVSLSVAQQFGFRVLLPVYISRRSLLRSSNTNANVYGAVITAEPLREFTGFI